ncbi:LOW QUALITY PROTEIN: hypothetical protein TorRG33x02_247010, partial [Trema orientale]
VRQAETARVSGERDWREGTEGRVWRERLLWRLGLLVLLLLLLGVEEEVGTSEKLLASETKSFGDGGTAAEAAVVVVVVQVEEEQVASQDRSLMAGFRKRDVTKTSTYCG